MYLSNQKVLTPNSSQKSASSQSFPSQSKAKREAARSSTQTTSRKKQISKLLNLRLIAVIITVSLRSRRNSKVQNTRKKISIVTFKRNLKRRKRSKRTLPPLRQSKRHQTLEWSISNCPKICALAATAPSVKAHQKTSKSALPRTLSPASEQRKEATYLTHSLYRWSFERPNSNRKCSE